MTDPIGTAQERELIEDISAKLANAQSSVLLRGDDEQKRSAYREFAKIAVRADALQSRIAESEAMREALQAIAEGNLGDRPWQANYARIRETARAALSLHRRPT